MMPSMNIRRQLTELVLLHNRRFNVEDSMVQSLIQQLTDFMIQSMQQTELMTRRQSQRQLNHSP